MTTPGYSDRINHAFAFAAKHHDRQVREGARPPYLTHPANLAVMLTRYGQDEETVLAGILHDVVEDCARKPYTRDTMVARVREKWGEQVLQDVLAVTQRASDDEGNDLDAEERKQDVLARLATASERARWVYAADQLHSAASILADLRRTSFPEAVWGRLASGRDGTIAGFRRAYERLQEVGFRAPILDELRSTVETLERFESENAARPATR